MRKKFIIVLIGICVLIGAIALGYIVMVNKEESKTKKENNKTGQVIPEEKKQENQDENKEKVSKIELNSLIGTKLCTAIQNIPNIYSSTYYEELDQNGFSNRAKLLYTFIQITSLQEYQNMLRMSEDYLSSYVKASDLETVAKDYFGKEIKLRHEDILGSSSYDEVAQNYVIMPIGFGGMELEYTKEIVYDIEEKSDIVTVYAYRFYCKNVTKEEEALDEIYYDKAKTQLAISYTDMNVYEDDYFVSTIQNDINANKINTQKAQKQCYTFTKEEGKFYFQKVENI